MTTNPPDPESKMLVEVRRWRKEAYEELRRADLAESRKQLAELARRFGLRQIAAVKERRIEPLPPADQ